MSDKPLTTEAVNHCQLPYSFAQGHGVLLDNACSSLRILYRAGLQPSVLIELRRYLAEGFQTQLVDDKEFQRRISQAFQVGHREAIQVAEGLSDDINLSRLAEEIPDTGDLMDGEDGAPVIQLINALISQAVREKASDIHIETYEDRLTVRFRIDGILAEVLSPKRLLAPMLVSRIKVMTKLDIAEKRLPQDGRMSVRIAGHGVDIRVSIMPSAHGERVVMRLLDKQAGQLELPQLQMNPQVLQNYKKALTTPHGIVLVTGPTGSGKTTTLYAGLMQINNNSQNILTIEDPIEYSLPGIGQTQVNTKVNMTFAKGLRSILRQDPDVVMLGEIRDTETAKIAVQASLTGHLVLSTLHTNTAIGAISRLQDMGVEPFLLSSSLIAVMSQRLVRLLCPACKQSHQPAQSELTLLGISYPIQGIIYRATGCQQCKLTGYHQRAAIYELIEIDEQLKLMIHASASEHNMLKVARTLSSSIIDDGRRRVLAGETTIEEVLRVTTA